MSPEDLDEFDSSRSKDDLLVAVTDGGQPLALDERLTFGSKSWSDVQIDKHQYDFQGDRIFPSCSTARTTFYAREAWDNNQYKTLFKLHHGRGHTWEGWDGQRVRQEDIGDYQRSSAILSQTVSDAFVKRQARSRVMRENLQGFSRHYAGLDGATLGFATLYKYDDVEEALDSHFVDVAEEMFGIDGENLVEYVWRKYGDNQ